MWKLVRRLAVLALVAIMLAAGYVAAPFYTAWSIREAIAANDSAYLDRKIEWEPVRATLKLSLARYAVTSPQELTAPSASPSLWQRTKAYLGKSAIDRFVDTTVTATGLHGVMMMRRNYEAVFSSEDAARRPPALERIRSLWSRVTRAEFTRIDRLELEMIDEFEPQRTVVCALELKGAWAGVKWKLTELGIKPTAKDAAGVTLAQQ